MRIRAAFALALLTLLTCTLGVRFASAQGSPPIPTGGGWSYEAPSYEEGQSESETTTSLSSWFEFGYSATIPYYRTALANWFIRARVAAWSRPWQAFAWRRR